MPVLRPILLAGAAALLAACGGHDAGEADARPSGEGTILTVRDTVVPTVIEAAGLAAPVQEATLSTKLMGSVTEVLVREGDRVAPGTVLVRLDARELNARRQQVEAGIGEAEAVRNEAEVQLRRIRNLYADSAAARAQLDAAETGYARAEAAVRTARAAMAELEAMAGYAVVTAPFAGTVTRRFVDPGAFAAPGAPLVSVEDGSRLRVTVQAAPAAVRDLRRGSRIEAVIEGVRTTAVIEGVVPAGGGSTYEVNAVVENGAGRFLPRSSATLALPQGTRSAVVVPEAALRREGDLVGVLVRGTAGDDLRWVRLGRVAGGQAEVLSGLNAGEQVVVPAAGR